jgi:hypothetical protein
MDRDSPGDAPDARVAAHLAMRTARALVVIGVGLASVLLVLSSPVLETWYAGVFLFLVDLGVFYLAYRWDLLRERRFLAAWVAVALGLGTYSALTGHFNGLTDEPYGTPAFVQLFPNLYGRALHLSYNQYGTSLSFTYAYVYLPFLTFIQVPGIDYRWVTIAAWFGSLYLTRSNPALIVLFGSPTIGLLAGNGFNDFVPLFVLTLFFVTLTGRSARGAEVVALGLKQFANALIVLYYIWHRRWTEVLIAVGVTVAFLLPFAWLSPQGVVCHAILLNPSATCSAGGSAAFVAGGAAHLNYYIWPLWALAVFGARYVADLRGPAYASERARVAQWMRRPGRPPASARPSDRTLLLLPFVRLVSRIRGAATPPVTK